MVDAYSTPILARLLANRFLAIFFSVLKIAPPYCGETPLLPLSAALVLYDLLNTTFGSNSDLRTLL